LNLQVHGNHLRLHLQNRVLSIIDKLGPIFIAIRNSQKFCSNITFVF
jgi:hypothetical protein